jgi:flagellar basal-body rod modification protein FlgD
MPGASIQNLINPPVPVTKNDFSAAEISDPTKPVEAANPNKTDFRTLITNSMDEVKKQRAAKENGDLSAQTDAEFLEKLADQTREKRVPKNQLGKDDFLKLFVTQLQNQDPLNPDDGTEMAAKLAQFNGLEQMMNVNKSLEKLLSDQTAGRNLQMVNYVGREVTVEGGRTKLKDGTPTKADFNLEMPAANATLEVRDSNGMIVLQKDLGALSAGTHPVPWDGKNNTGRVQTDGVYTYSINARNVNGDAIPVTLTAKARITGVDIKSTDGTLFSDFGKIKFDQIRSVGRPGFEADAEAAATVSTPTGTQTAPTGPAQNQSSPAAGAQANSGASPTSNTTAAVPSIVGKTETPSAPMTDELERMKAQGTLGLSAKPEANSGVGSPSNNVSDKKAVDPKRKDSAKLTSEESKGAGTSASNVANTNANRTAPSAP